MARSDAPTRHRRRTLVAHPADEPVRRPGRPLSGGLLLGLILHDARAHRERPHRSREEHARQLCVPDQNGGAYPERQPDILFEPQPAAILRRHGRVVRAGHGYHPCPAIPRRLGGGTRVLDERGGASRTRGGPGVPPRRAAPRGRAAPQPLLGRPARAPARLEPAYDPATGSFSAVRWGPGARVTDRPSLAAAFPLYCGLATPEQGRAVAARLGREFLKPGGFVTTLIASGQQWDAPNGSPPLEWLAIEGVRRYGRGDLATRARDRWLALNRRTSQATGRMTEKYDVV